MGIWTGFDSPRTLGEDEGGGAVAGVIFTEFMDRALAERAAIPFRIPPGVRLVAIDAMTGELPTVGSQDVILEAYRPGTEPGKVFTQTARLSLSGDGDRSVFGTATRRDEIDQGGADISPDNDDVVDCDPLFDIC